MLSSSKRLKLVPDAPHFHARPGARVRSPDAHFSLCRGTYLPSNLGWVPPPPPGSVSMSERCKLLRTLIGRLKVSRKYPDCNTVCCCFGESQVFHYQYSFLLISVFTNIGLFRNSIGNLSDQYPTPVVPADYTFAIWGLIYSWFTLWLVYVITSLFRTNRLGPGLPQSADDHARVPGRRLAQPHLKHDVAVRVGSPDVHPQPRCVVADRNLALPRHLHPHGQGLWVPLRLQGIRTVNGVLNIIGFSSNQFI